MKVLRPGRNQKGWSHQFTCTGQGNNDGGCGAHLLIEEDDIFVTERHSYPDEHETFNTFKCISCGVKTDIPKDIALPFTPPLEKAWLDRHPETK